jgi:hypothetical protein
MYNTPYNHFPQPITVGHPEEITGNFYSDIDDLDPSVFLTNDHVPYTEQEPEAIVADDLDVITIKTITTESVNGTGIFDHFMRAIRNQLQREWDDEKIDKTQFVEAYVSQMQPTLEKAIAYARLDMEAKVQAMALQKMAQEIVEMKASGAESRLQSREGARKTEAETELIIVQMAEMAENGASERELKKSQIQVQEQQAQLYHRQTLGFDDKRKADILKVMMDTYAVVASEVDAAPNPPAVFTATAIHTLAMDAMSDVGLAISKDTANTHYYTGDIGWVPGQYSAEQPITSIPTT